MIHDDHTGTEFGVKIHKVSLYNKARSQDLGEAVANSAQDFYCYWIFSTCNQPPPLFVTVLRMVPFLLANTVSHSLSETLPQRALRACLQFGRVPLPTARS